MIAYRTIRAKLAQPKAPTPEAQEVRRRRRALGLPQKWLAFEAGCCRTRLTEIERGSTGYSSELMARLMAVLEREERRDPQAVADAGPARRR